MERVRNARIWRSLLYVPANNKKFLDKALQRGADAIVLDLEDSVPFDEKDKARAQCGHALEEFHWPGNRYYCPD